MHALSTCTYIWEGPDACRPPRTARRSRRGIACCLAHAALAASVAASLLFSVEDSQLSRSAIVGTISALLLPPLTHLLGDC